MTTSYHTAILHDIMEADKIADRYSTGGWFSQRSYLKNLEYPQSGRRAFIPPEHHFRNYFGSGSGGMESETHLLPCSYLSVQSEF